MPLRLVAAECEIAQFARTKWERESFLGCTIRFSEVMGSYLTMLSMQTLQMMLVLVLLLNVIGHGRTAAWMLSNMLGALVTSSLSYCHECGPLAASAERC